MKKLLYYQAAAYFRGLTKLGYKRPLSIRDIEQYSREDARLTRLLTQLGDPK